jgi:hypothetical protein
MKHRTKQHLGFHSRLDTLIGYREDDYSFIHENYQAINLLLSMQAFHFINGMVSIRTESVMAIKEQLRTFLERFDYGLEKTSIYR